MMSIFLELDLKNHSDNFEVYCPDSWSFWQKNVKLLELQFDFGPLLVI